MTTNALVNTPVAGNANSSANPQNLPLPGGADVGHNCVYVVCVPLGFTPAPSGWTVSNKGTPWGDHNVFCISKVLDSSDISLGYMQLRNGATAYAYVVMLGKEGSSFTMPNISSNANNVAIGMPAIDPSWTGETTWIRIAGQWSGGGSPPTQPPTKGDSLSYLSVDAMSGAITLGITGVYGMDSNDDSLAADSYSFSTSAFRWGASVAFNAPIPITVIADDKSKTYGDADPSLTASLDSGSLRSGDYIDADISREAGETVDTYVITLDSVVIRDSGDVDVSNLYEISVTGGTFTINLRPITYAGVNASKTYGDADPTLTAEITAGTLVSGDSISGTFDRDAGEEAGNYSFAVVTATVLDGVVDVTDQYDITLVSALFDINVRPITLTAENKSKLEGQADPALTVEVSAGSLAFDDAVTGSLARDAGETPGQYDITQGTVTITSDPHSGNAANYDITWEDGLLTIIDVADAAGTGLSIGIGLGMSLSI